MRIVLVFLLLSAVLDGLFSGFVFVSSEMTWSNAQTYREQHFTDLASIHDMTEVQQLFGVAGSSSFWIGLHRVDDVWIWSDQSAFTFDSWADGEPNYESSELCAISKNFEWFSVKCEVTYSFVCYDASTQNHNNPTSAPTLKIQILRLEVKSDQNVNDPEVQINVLEKIKQVLKMKGLDGNATLSWRNQSDGNVFQKDQEYNVTQQICH